jgi:CRP-like cAMP-binding protein
VAASADPKEPNWQFGFMAGLDPSGRAAVLRVGRTRKYTTGEVVFREGDASEFAVVVLAGRLKVSSTSMEGHDTVLAFRGSGDLLGELSLFDGSPRSATVAAIEPAQLVLITADRFTELMRAEPQIAAVLLRTIVGKLRDADRQRLEFGAYDTTGRVARRLVQLADEHGVPGSVTTGGVRITLPLSQTELAGWTGSSREAVARALALLRRKDLITTDRRSIVVLDLASLRSLAY